DGEILLARNFGGTESVSANAIATDSKNNIFIAGDFFGELTFGSDKFTSGGGLDSFICKLDRDGNPVWLNQNKGSDWNNTFDLTVDIMDNIIATGYFINATTFGSV